MLLLGLWCVSVGRRDGLGECTVDSVDPTAGVGVEICLSFLELGV